MTSLVRVTALTSNDRKSSFLIQHNDWPPRQASPINWFIISAWRSTDRHGSWRKNGIISLPTRFRTRSTLSAPKETLSLTSGKLADDITKRRLPGTLSLTHNLALNARAHWTRGRTKLAGLKILQIRWSNWCWPNYRTLRYSSVCMWTLLWNDVGWLHKVRLIITESPATIESFVRIRGVPSDQFIRKRPKSHAKRHTNEWTPLKPLMKQANCVHWRRRCKQLCRKKGRRPFGRTHKKRNGKTVGDQSVQKKRSAEGESFNRPFTPKFKKYILPTF